jgi:lysine 2,3-aminomutase
MLEWKKQEKNAIRSLDELAKFVNFTKKELKNLEKVCSTFCMKITPYYLNLIDKNNPKDPLKLMAIPSIKELNIKKGEMEDPIGDTNPELDNQPEKAITHRYHDRVLLYPTPECGGYCRHCFRRRLAGNQDHRLSDDQLKTAIDYIKSNDIIHEVILTGGDPLMLSDAKLMSILNTINKIPHVWTIRIHTRMPVWNPYRITDDLVNKLKKIKPLWVVTHFNHPKEVSGIAVKHTQKLIDNGIMVLNQAVLLKNVNDSADLQRELSWTLIKARIKPYYLHQLDKAKGTSHFRVGVKRGLKILRDIRGTVPGYGIPHYIIDLPGGYGKIPIQYHYLNEDGKGTIIAETPSGNLRPYVDGVDEKPVDIKKVGKLKPSEFYS